MLLKLGKTELAFNEDFMAIKTRILRLFLLLVQFIS